MSNAKTLGTVIDIEKQDNERNTQSEESEVLEKVKLKAPPGINASLVLLYAIFFFMFVIGWLNLNNCSVSRLIPIYLIVAGALTKSLSGTTDKHLFNVVIALALFYIVWHCLGTYWVYKEYQPNYEETVGEKYCNRTTFLLAFWILTIQHTILGFIILLSGCIMLMKDDFVGKK
ncbi:transmembrane protein 272-like isoform X2 [Tribolium madens]|uniref:transmembrane protein 272-like isoform X2 n=1 Tax=Tribolium madens TaxID=41895 RepID=UPI001CF76549|nr:transmembrane protein 272-like isoform X2 [Tribolium madens]